MSHSLNMHDGVSCDGCNVTAFSGNRYKCLRCTDYDLCQICYITKRYGEQSRTEVVPHEESHPMQLMMTHADFEIVYAGDPSKNFEICKIASFVCPYCNVSGFSARAFGTHVTTIHCDPPPYNVICPVCIATPDMEHSGNRDTENLKTHWIEFHAAGMDNYRTEPLRTGAGRRPMLARRTGRQPAGTRGNIPAATTTAVPNTLPTGLVWPTAERTGDVNLEEVLRSLNPTNPIDALRLGEQLFPTPASREQLRAQIAAQRSVFGVPPVNEYAQPRTTTATSSSQSAPNIIQVIRPIRAVPIYPPVNETAENDENLSVTCDESHIDTDSQDESGKSDVPEDESADESVDADSTPKVCDVGCEGENEVEKNLEPEEASDNEFEERRRAQELELHSKLTPPEVEAVLSVLRTGQPRENLVADEDHPVFERPRKVNKASTSRSNTQSSASEDNEQNWLSLQFDIPSLRSFGAGTYWSDKRFLRQRKLQREQSSMTPITDDLERGEVALAICRAAMAGPVPTVFKAYDLPDKSLRRALRNINFADFKTSELSAGNETRDENLQNLLRDATRRYESESEAALSAEQKALAGDSVDNMQAQGNETEVSSSSNDDEDERQDVEDSDDA